MTKRALGVCYYPEHWPETQWDEDARRMAELGLTWVRIGEFAWGRIEPKPGQFDWGWLDRAIDVLGSHGLKVVLGTPTATPPKWVLDRHPDMLAVDQMGHPRKFGSRRHYCFSHQGYLQESARIVTEFARRYGRNPHVGAWQTDNEYGCHDTVLSYSDAARSAFRDWLRGQFPAVGRNDGDIAALNQAWGNVFWSMEYADFDDIDLPNLTVTEPNPAHVLAFRRFSSDQVRRYNLMQVEILRKHSDAPLSHNYMGRVTEFDHYKLGEDLDIATWDSYPLGFLEDRVGASIDQQRHFARQGDPDFQAFHHDLYRAVGRGRWWVMEQQPGPVNWAPYNPAPASGMVRLWTWEAFAHGAEAVCYFRWRQAPFAQEQMHAGLLRPDSAEAEGFHEAHQVARELSEAPEVQPVRAEVALIFDYDAEWAWAVQPHGQGLSYFGLVLEHYRALRRAGLSVDIVPPAAAAIQGYKLVLAPGLMHIPEALKSALSQCGARVLLGPRSAARDGHMAIPVPLPPAFPGLDVTVSRCESLRPDMPEPLEDGGHITGYREHLDHGCKVVMQDRQGGAVAVEAGDTIYVGAWLDAAGLDRLVAGLCDQAGLPYLDLPPGVRCRDTANERFWFNYDLSPVDLPGIGHLPACGVLRRDRG